MKTLPILLLCLISLPPSAIAAPERPNIIVIMVDDMGWSDIGCYGSEIDTPNIDRIAQEGMLFTQFYNNAKCTTTRASLITGLYPRNGGKGQDQLITKQMLTLGEAMRHAGYKTGMSGKWHNGKTPGTRPYDRGFDEAYGLWDGCCNFFNPKIPDPKFKGGRIRPFGHNDKFLEFDDFPDDYYTTDAFTDHAIETIKAHVRSGKPFFHYLPYTAPHYPLHAKPADIAKYKGRYAEGWDVLRQQRLARQKELGLVKDSWVIETRDDRAKPWEEAKSIDPEWQQLRMEVYAAMIDSVDQNIGRLLKALDKLKVADNTLILFLTDNGGCAETPGGNDPKQIPGPREYYSHAGPGWASASNTPFRRYKQYCHEGGIATPLVARWPKTIKPGTRTDQVGHIIDFLPTFLEMAKADYPDRHPEFKEPTLPLDGKSLLPVLQGKKRKAHKYLCWHWSTNRAVRKGDWKLAWDKHEKTWELYDLAKDRTEAHDLASRHPKLVEELTDKWNVWAQMTGVKTDKKKKKK
ncbi:MAG: arylsulfatase [Verrucomicrobiales bacterium]|nr:arylsulfatase [Verrucomicrobiales bacterium]|tara:strand:- start:336 stop:1892 length:1557 start_codon:yes stop_codon:yes gene_type:complete